MSNGTGDGETIRASRAKDMEIFDTLPRRVRASLRAAQHNYAAQHAQNLMVAGGPDWPVIVIQQEDARRAVNR